MLQRNCFELLRVCVCACSCMRVCEHLGAVKNYSPLITFRLTLGPSVSFSVGTNKYSFGLKRPEEEAYHLPQFNDNVKN